ncbi:MAG: Mur ligase family protein [Chloroflexota bacterium]
MTTSSQAPQQQDVLATYKAATYFLDSLINLPVQHDYLKAHTSPAIYLKRTQYFLDLVNNPEQGGRYIHIAGTAGKGTVSNLIQKMLLNQGHKVGVYTSPFLTTAIEKIKVDDLYISPQTFVTILEGMKPAINQAYRLSPYGGPSYFEIMLAIGLTYFQQQQCDWIILEVGLGGRYDATNIIPDPKVTAITNIDYDHTELLGRSLTKIAYAKAGIIKTNSHFFTTEQRPHLLKQFKTICSQVEATYHHVSTKGQDRTSANQALVTKIGHYLEVDQYHIETAFKDFRLPGRFEVLQNNPQVILDGAHNAVKAQTTVANLKMCQYRSLYLIIGLKQDKETEAILSLLVPLAHHTFVTRFQVANYRCVHPVTLFAQAQNYCTDKASVEMFLDPHQALQKVLKMADPQDLVLITGSFYLAGELRTHWYDEDRILETRCSF